MMLLALLSSLPQVQAECPKGPLELVGALTAYDAAFNQMDEAAASASRERARHLLTCLDEPVSTGAAAAFHRMEGFDAFLANDQARALAALRAAFTLSPSYTPDLSVAPAGGALLELIARARQPIAESGAGLEMPSGWTLLVDGQGAESLPSNRAAIAQVRDARSALRWTGWLLPGEPLPKGLLPEAKPVPAGPRYPALRLRLSMGVDTYAYRYRCQEDCPTGAAIGDWSLAEGALFDWFKDYPPRRISPAASIRASGWLPMLPQLGLEIHDHLLAWNAPFLYLDGASESASNLGTFVDHQLAGTLRGRWLWNFAESRAWAGLGLGLSRNAPAILVAKNPPDSAMDFTFQSESQLLPLVLVHGGLERGRGFFALGEFGTGLDFSPGKIRDIEGNLELGWEFHDRWTLGLSGEWTWRYLGQDSASFAIVDERMGAGLEMGWVYQGR